MKEIKKGFNQIKYQNDYKKKNYDRLEIIVPKGLKEIIKNVAKDKNISVNKFVNSAIEEKLNNS